MKTTHSLLHGTATKVTEARHTAPLLCEAVSEPLPKLSRDDTAQAKARVRHSAPLPFQDYRRPHRRDAAVEGFISSHSFFNSLALSNDGSTETEEEGVHLSHVCINLVKCAVGAGSFSLPFAMVQTGLFAGIAGLILFGLVGGYTMTLLADAEKAVLARRATEAETNLDNVADLEGLRVGQENPLPGGTTVEELGARLTYPELVAALFPSWRVCGRNIPADTVYAAIILTSIGVCVAYVLFIVSTLTAAFGWNADMLMVAVFFPILALALLRSFQYLAYTSILGDVAVVCGIFGTIWGGFSDGHTLHWPHHMPAINTDWYSGDLLQGLATISFLFLVHILTLPMAQSLHHDLQEPKQFHRVVGISYSFITVLNLFFAVFCVCLFHGDPEGIQNPVIKNLNQGVIAQTIRVLLCLDLLFTIPMVMAVGREIVEESIVPLMPERHTGMTRNLVRLGLVLAVCGLSEGAIKSSGINQAFGDVLNLLGGFTNTLVGLIIPPLVYAKAQTNGGSATFNTLLGCISLVGGFLLVSSTYYTLRSMAS